MRGLRCACAAFAALGGFVPSAFADDPPLIELPKFFIFMEGTPCNYTDPQDPNERPVAPFTKQMVSIFLGHPANGNTPTGMQAANYAADYILRHTQPSSWAADDPCYGTTIRPPDLDPTNICITFNGFGRDFRDVDCDAGYCDPFYANSSLRFFTEDDRLPNYIDPEPGYPPSPDGTFGFPEYVNAPSPPSACGSCNVPISHRTYRHPFLKNAGPNSTLRAWFSEFVAQYIIRQSQPGVNLPNPTQFYFDTEATISYPGSADETMNNGPPVPRGSSSYVRILEQIYASRDLPINDPKNLWRGVPVPGDPTNGMTLEGAYLRDLDKFGLTPSSINALRSTSLQDGSTLPASAEQNRRVMAWFQEVCRRSFEAVMWNVAYQTIHQTWPNAKYGNYGSAQQDGRLTKVGVVQTSNARAIATTPQDLEFRLDYRAHRYGAPVDPTTRSTFYAHNGMPEPFPALSEFTEMMPRCTVGADRDSGYFWHLNSDRTGDIWASERRWGTVVQSTYTPVPNAKIVDSPTVYALATTQGLYEIVRQRNAYSRRNENNRNMFESRQESGDRLKRILAESVEGGYSSDPGARPFVPWIEMIGSARESTQTMAFSGVEFAQDIALLRSKRVKEAVLFAYSGLRRADAGGIASTARSRTEQAIRDVYSPRIVKFTRSEDASPTSDPVEIDKLEDTLNGPDGLPKALNLSASDSGASLNVRFDDCLRLHNNADLSRLVYGSREFLLYLECTAYDGLTEEEVRAADVDFRVECARADGTTFALASFDGQTIVSSGRNTFGVVRCSWHVPLLSNVAGTPPLDPSNITIKTGRSGGAYHIKFDLIQLIPYQSIGAHIVGDSCSPQVVLPTNSNAANPVVVNATLFQQAGPTGGFKVAWNAPIFGHDLDDVSHDRKHYVRIYRFMNTDGNPLADVTCSTEQSFATNTQTSGQDVHIRYRPTGSETPKPMPGGLYKFSTISYATDLTMGCRGWIYPQLRTEISGPFESEPLVASESFWVNVIGAPSQTTSPCVGFACTFPNNPRSCVADVDDGSGTGTSDGGVTIDDLLYYLVIFEMGSVCADVDDGGFEGCRDAGVTIDDLLYYLYRFEAGC